MSWLPSFSVRETVLCHFDGESEGWELRLTWRGFTIELTLARRTRLIGEADA